MSDAIIEAAARALNGTYETHYGMAQAVVAAVTPLIEAAALEWAAKMVEDMGEIDDETTWSSIARDIRALKQEAGE